MTIICTQTGKELDPTEINFDLLDRETQQELVRKWVDKNVIYDVTYLFDHGMILEDGEEYEKKLEFSRYEKWEGAARWDDWEPISEWLRSDPILKTWRQAKDWHPSLRDAITDDEFYVKIEDGVIIDTFEPTGYSDNPWQELCEHASIEPETEYACSYYIVTDHFNAYVGGAETFNDLLVWPRFCGGQSIALDQDVINAYREFHNKYR